MESHVSGGHTPLSLGELRRDLLAALIGNHLFTPAEQLQANHHAHECECPNRLALWLRNVQHEAARRRRVLAAQARTSQQIVGCDKTAQTNELQQLAQCPALTHREQEAIHWLPVQKASCLEVMSFVGQYYVTALRRTGKLPDYGI